MSDSGELAVASAALVIAVFAAISAIAQAAQQYLITGQLIRLCDSVVFGLLPGQGRRIWEWSQFRFRIVYDLPLFGIDPDLWPASAVPTFTGAEAGKRAIRAEERKTLGWRLATRSCTGADEGIDRRALAKPYVGEASWASFCRTIHPSCYASLLFWFIEGDADRVPSDLPTIPMPVSLRDTAVLALMTGMECTAADFNRGSISMRGEAGTITSATHPILGPILHYTPPLKVAEHFIVHTARIYKDWLWRAMDNCVVAGNHYNGRGRMDVEIKRGTFERFEWVRKESRSFERGGRPKPRRLEISKSGPGPDEKEGEGKRPKTQSCAKGDGAWHFLPRPPSGISSEEARPDLHSQPDFVTLKASVPWDQRPRDSRKPRARRRHADVRPEPELLTFLRGGRPNRQSRPNRPWTSGTPDAAESADEDGTGAEDEEERSSGREYEHESGLSGSKLGSEIVTERGRSEHDDEREILRRLKAELELTCLKREFEFRRLRQEEGHAAGESQPVHYNEPEAGQSHHEIEDEHEASESKCESEGEDGSGMTFSEVEYCEQREAEERKLYAWREERRRLLMRDESETLGQIKWFWLAQTDILPGYWATPWKSFVNLSVPVCVGATHVLIEAIIEKLGAGGIDFEPFMESGPGHALVGTVEWMRQGRSTYPAYAYKADGGIVCSGGYAPYTSTNPGLFSTRIPAVPLLDSFSNQVSDAEKKSKQHCERRLLELMRLDAWLSLAGRTPEIAKGETDLLVYTPALVQKLIDSFGRDFLELYVDGRGGDGSREMSRVVARDVVRFLGRECGEGAEVVYVLVAALRAVKVGFCVLAGADTAILGEIFEKDVLVYLV